MTLKASGRVNLLTLSVLSLFYRCFARHMLGVRMNMILKFFRDSF